MATATALVLTQDGRALTVEYKDTSESTYQMEKIAVGGIIESVSYWTKNVDAYVNEEFLYTPGLYQNPFAANIRQRWMGNIVIPRMTPNKRAKLESVGLLMCNDGLGSPVIQVADLQAELDKVLV